jgi:hypothetical protein
MRRPADIKRIEDCIHGVIDSLLLFDTSLFYEEQGLKIIRHIVRMIITIGVYNLGSVVGYWKSLCDYLYNRAADFSQRLDKPGKENFFATLLSWPKVQRILDGDLSKDLMESFAHLTSTRQMPVGDRRKEAESVAQFFRSVEEPYPVDLEFLNQIFQVSRNIGHKCLSFGKIISYPHISMSCAGSYYHTVKDGGRGREIRESLSQHLRFRPILDESVETPFGSLHCPAGEPRWRYWCRETPYQHYPGIDFGEIITEEVFNNENMYYQGFDEVIGRQIMVVSYLEYRDWSKTGLAIPCRVLTVPEPGFKARIVTTGPFWLNTLQQGLSHAVKDILKNHPSVRSSLQKTDQAWQSLYLMSNKVYNVGFKCLSSDLKEATDHIPKVVGVQLLSGFLSGSGLRSNLTDICLDLVSRDRCFIGHGHVSERQERGIMMGEPLTKVILTLLNLFVEENAMRSFLKVSSGRVYDSPPWRTYHIGGDDHLAIGPPLYLGLITLNHKRCGSVLSIGKHGISNKVVKYCEKVLDIHKVLSKPFDVRRINDSTEAYEASPFVDSIKVRLLSPLTKSFEVVSDRNVAIGKGISLGRTLKWLNRDHFPTKWVHMVRDRFLVRMGSLLPDRSSGVYWHLMLPSFWGGLDLYLLDEVEEIYNKVPVLTLSVMESFIDDRDEFHYEHGLMSKLLSNYSYRGYRLNETDIQAMRSHFEVVIKQFMPSKRWHELKREFDPNGEESAKSLADRIYCEGWYDEHSIMEKLSRPILFKEILLGRERPSVYNTEHLKMRYSKLWDLIYKGESRLSLESFRTCLKAKPPGMFYKVSYPEEIHFASDRGYIYKSVIDDALHGMPILCIGMPFA